MEDNLSLTACVFKRLLANCAIPAKLHDFEFDFFTTKL